MTSARGSAGSVAYGVGAGRVDPVADRAAHGEGTGSGAQSVGVRLDVDVDDPCAGARGCTPEGAGLTYVRRDDAHGYAARRGEIHVIVSGGLRVDRALLRRAALDARLATDEELFRALPPAPSKTRLQRILDRLRR